MSQQNFVELGFGSVTDEFDNVGHFGLLSTQAVLELIKKVDDSCNNEEVSQVGISATEIEQHCLPHVSGNFMF